MRRMEVYNEFVRKRAAVLFATDIAARGLGKSPSWKTILDIGNIFTTGCFLEISDLVREK
jgi:hypothetical protein